MGGQRSPSEPPSAIVAGPAALHRKRFAEVFVQEPPPALGALGVRIDLLELLAIALLALAVRQRQPFELARLGAAPQHEPRAAPLPHEAGLLQ